MSDERVRALLREIERELAGTGRTVLDVAAELVASTLPKEASPEARVVVSRGFVIDFESKRWRAEGEQRVEPAVAKRWEVDGYRTYTAADLLDMPRVLRSLDLPLMPPADPICADCPHVRSEHYYDSHGGNHPDICEVEGCRCQSFRSRLVYDGNRTPVTPP